MLFTNIQLDDFQPTHNMMIPTHLVADDITLCLRTSISYRTPRYGRGLWPCGVFIMSLKGILGLISLMLGQR